MDRHEELRLEASPAWRGGSTPAVWGERIFLTSQDGGNLVLLCIDTKGKELWKRKLGTGRAKYGVFKRDEGNQASPSPSTDGKHVFAFVGTGDFACFDFEGKELWRFNAQDRYGKFRIQHGMHVTPLLHGDRLYLSLLHSAGWWIIAIDKPPARTSGRSSAPATPRMSASSPTLPLPCGTKARTNT